MTTPEGDIVYYDCPFCGDKVNADDVDESKNIECPKCGSIIGGPVWAGMPPHAYEIFKRDVEEASKREEEEEK